MQNHRRSSRAGSAGPLLLALAAVLFSSGLWAAEPQQRRFAILVGVNEYMDPGLLALDTPRNDAKDLGILLSAAGWDKVFVMTDDAEARSQDFPTRGNIERRVSLISSLAAPTDTILLFFSGHGVSEGGIDHFLPVDADSERLGITSLRLQDQVRAFGEKGLTRVVLMVDACREAVTKTKGLTVVGVTGAAAGGQAAYGFYATMPGWFSYEDRDGRNGVFTRQLLRGLSGEAAGAAGGNRDAVTFADLEKWLPDAVASYALDAGIRQKPTVSVGQSGLGQLVVARNGAPPAQSAAAAAGRSAPAPAGVPAMRFARGASGVAAPSKYDELFTIDDFFTIKPGTGVRMKVFNDGRPKSEYWLVAQDMRQGEKSDFSWAVLHGLYSRYTRDRNEDFVEFIDNGNSVNGWLTPEGTLWAPREFSGRDDAIDIEWAGDRANVSVTALASFTTSAGLTFPDCVRMDVRMTRTVSRCQYFVGTFVIAKGLGLVFADGANSRGTASSKPFVAEAAEVKQFPPRQFTATIVPPKGVEAAAYCVAFAPLLNIRYLKPDAQGRVSTRIYGDRATAYTAQKFVDDGGGIDLRAKGYAQVPIDAGTQTEGLTLQGPK